MIRFEVTGATPEEFAENAMKAWGLLAIGLQNAMIGAKIVAQVEAAVRDTTPTQTCGSGNSSTSSKVAEPAPSTATTTNPATVHSDPVQDLFVENPNPSTASSPISPMEKSPKGHGKSKGPKLDDLKTRLSEVIVAATERWDQKRANAYARKLLNEWRAPKLSDLAADQYEIFMRVSAAYLDGDAAE